MMKLSDMFNFETWDATKHMAPPVDPAIDELIRNLEGTLGESPEAIRGAGLAFIWMADLCRQALACQVDSLSIAAITEIVQGFIESDSVAALRQMEEAGHEVHD